jgi:hypothetical protein
MHLKCVRVGELRSAVRFVRGACVSEQLSVLVTKVSQPEAARGRTCGLLRVSRC